MVQLIVNAFVLCLMAHMIGDYFIQNDWMALEKTKHWWPAVIHGITYTIPFIPVVLVLQPTGHSILGLTSLNSVLYALVAIGGTHALIDHWSLARHVVWAKNQLVPKDYRPGHTMTGHGEDRPLWLTLWLVIIVDNCIHMAINTASVVWL